MEQDEFQNMEEYSSNQTKKSGQDTNRIMGIAAIFISVLSMFAVIYQSYLAREENELIRIQQSATVLPYLSSWFSENDGKLQIVFSNKGVGPAFIKEVKFKAIDLENKDSLLFKNSDRLFSFIKEKSEFLKPIRLRTSFLKANTLLSKNEIKEIAEFYYEDNKQLRLIREELQKFNISFEITYEDVYGSVWIYHSNKGFPEKLRKN